MSYNSLNSKSLPYISKEQIKLQQELQTELLIKEETIEISDESDLEEIQPVQIWFSFEHKRIHSKGKPYIRVHYGKPYACDVCDQKFNRKMQLIEHKLIHVREKPFESDSCDKTFTMIGNFIEQKLHSREKPFTCDVCDQKFNRKMQLIEHKLIHVREKPFTSDSCDERFTTATLARNLINPKLCYKHKFNLIRHKRIHSEEKSVKEQNTNSATRLEFQLTQSLSSQVSADKNNANANTLGVCDKSYNEQICSINNKNLHYVHGEHVKLQQELETELIIKDEIIEILDESEGRT
ncbi:zinc finger protein 675-like [Chrysoperla carnea]|uniref:zinc finger protein 675-like n=1 Tax=Chrysoperla carnea TaxID=189513 RepID=UPI001D08D1F2|nr:zinc finger protein 675-like [Chrysoperla carnea]